MLIILCSFLLFLPSYKEERTQACKDNRHDYKHRNHRNRTDACANKLQPLIQCVHTEDGEDCKCKHAKQPVRRLVLQQISDQHTKHIRSEQSERAANPYNQCRTHTFICAKCDRGKLCLITKLCYKKCTKYRKRRKLDLRLTAFYLFFINSVFIALATYAMVRFLQYEKKVFIDKVRERTVKRLMMVITLVTFIPSVVIGFHMVRVSLFEAVADKYVSQVFNFPHTRVIECNKHYAQGKNPSQIELLLVGEPLGEEVIENARTQMRNFGLEEAELVVRQANTEDKVDVVSLQKSYQELLEEKNRRIGEMSSQLKRYRVTNVEVNDISREVGAMMDNIGAISLTKGITFDVEGTPGDTTLVCVVTPRDSALPVDRETLIRWLRIRTKVENVKLFVEP